MQQMGASFRIDPLLANAICLKSLILSFHLDPLIFGQFVTAKEYDITVCAAAIRFVPDHPTTIRRKSSGFRLVRIE
ncbi:hypothetical protein ABAC460_23130 [Asticcacaulis sp. AC460]|nr:hypothetical protein ABAC460_23130 [Asticcacaulis sp. AC460]